MIYLDFSSGIDLCNENVLRSLTIVLAVPILGKTVLHSLQILIYLILVQYIITVVRLVVLSPS